MNSDSVKYIDIKNLEKEMIPAYGSGNYFSTELKNGTLRFLNMPKYLDKYRFLFGNQIIDRPIYNLPVGAKYKIKSKLDDYAMIFVKNNNTISQYGLALDNEDRLCIVFETLQASNTRN